MKIPVVTNLIGGYGMICLTMLGEGFHMGVFLRAPLMDLELRIIHINVEWIRRKRRISAINSTESVKQGSLPMSQSSENHGKWIR